MPTSSDSSISPNGVGTVAELFAGVGGFRLALERSGLKTIFSNQWEPSTKSQHASDCYQFNFGPEGHLNIDIAEVRGIPTVDLLVGGFPCQDYSVAKALNTAQGLEGKKGVLWWEILRVLRSNKPKFVFLENVDRLLKSPSSQRGRDFAVMLRTLGDLGYLVEWRIVNSAEFGFPQRRIRVFIVAQLASPTSKLTAEEAMDILGNSGVLSRALPVQPITGPVERVDLCQDLETISTSFGRGARKSQFQNAGVYLEGVAFTTTCFARYEGEFATLGSILVASDQVPSEYWIDQDRVSEWIYLKGAKSIKRTHAESGVEYEYSEGKMSFPDSLDRPSRTILTGEGGVTPSRFKHVIEFEGRLRRLTPVELERLNGFPDGWTATGIRGPIKDGRRAFFMGNALVVGLVERVGKVLAMDLRARQSSN